MRRRRKQLIREAARAAKPPPGRSLLVVYCPPQPNVRIIFAPSWNGSLDLVVDKAARFDAPRGGWAPREIPGRRKLPGAMIVDPGKHLVEVFDGYRPRERLMRRKVMVKPDEVAVVRVMRPRVFPPFRRKGLKISRTPVSEYPWASE